MDECERAINLAINNNQPHIEALACEQIMIRNSDAFERASQAYERWGAYNKSVQIQNKYKRNLSVRALNKQLDIEAIYESSRVMANRPDQQVIQSSLLNNIKHIVDAKEGNIYLVDESTNSIDLSSIPVAYHSLVNKLVSFSENEEMTGEAIMALHSEYLEMSANDQGMLLVPLQIAGRVKGVIYLKNNNLPLVRSISQVNHILVLATQAAVLIENAEIISTLDKVQSRTRDLEIAQLKNIELEKKAIESRLTTALRMKLEIHCLEPHWPYALYR